MDTKTVILVIILGVIVGVGIFFGQKMLSGNTQASNPFKVGGNLTQAKAQKTPSPKPVPTFPPLDSNSNLKDEAEKLDPPDFSQDYTSLKSEVPGN